MKAIIVVIEQVEENPEALQEKFDNAFFEDVLKQQEDIETLEQDQKATKATPLDQEPQKTASPSTPNDPEANPLDENVVSIVKEHINSAEDLGEDVIEEGVEDNQTSQREQSTKHKHTKLNTPR